MDLWLPVLVAAALVFVASSIIHMCLPFHKKDFEKLPEEEGVMDAIRGHNVPPGEYYFPLASSMKEMGSPEMLEKFKRGPVGMMVLHPNGPPNMGKSLLQWFLYTLFVGFFVGYIATLGLDATADYMAVFRMTSATATLAYATANVTNSIWKGVSWGTTLKFFVDGVVYGLVTGGAFGWLWPAA
jgi:hypothetical protein